MVIYRMLLLSHGTLGWWCTSCLKECDLFIFYLRDCKTCGETQKTTNCEDSHWAVVVSCVLTCIFAGWMCESRADFPRNLKNKSWSCSWAEGMKQKWLQIRWRNIPFPFVSLFGCLFQKGGNKILLEYFKSIKVLLVSCQLSSVTLRG